MAGIYSMLWRCPRCQRVNGWTSRSRRPKKRIDTNCGACMNRVRFTPIRDKRGQPSQVSEYRIFSNWRPQRVIYRQAIQWNHQESQNQVKNRLDPEFDDSFNRQTRAGIRGNAPPTFSNWNLSRGEWE